MARKISFARWKKQAQAYAVQESLADDLWAADDPYDLFDAAYSAHHHGQGPVEFVEEMFADDIASRENDEQMADESADRGFEEDFDSTSGGE